MQPEITLVISITIAGNRQIVDTECQINAMEMKIGVYNFNVANALKCVKQCKMSEKWFNTNETRELR